MMFRCSMERRFLVEIENGTRQSEKQSRIRYSCSQIIRVEQELKQDKLRLLSSRG